MAVGVEEEEEARMAEEEEEAVEVPVCATTTAIRATAASEISGKSKVEAL